MKNPTYSIGDAAKLANISIKQIRSWESKGYISPPDRIVCGARSYRRFTADEVEMIASIKGYLDEGYTLPAAAEKAKTSNLNQRKESRPGGSD